MPSFFYGLCRTPVKLEESAVAQIIVGDIKYIPLQSRTWCYLAIWQDKITRRIIGWSLAERMTADLVIAALIKAINKGFIKAGANNRSDRGSQYLKKDFVNC